MYFLKKTCLVYIFLFSSGLIYSQIENIQEIIGKEKDSNPLQTAIPFLTIAPDSRSGALGDIGAATSPDANSMHWNPAKYAFVEDDMGFSVTFTPWLQNLVKDIYLGYLSGYKRIDKNQVFAASLLYFTLGDITFTDKNGDVTGSGKPNEFALDAAYSRLFGKRISGSIAFRFIRSDLTGGGYVSDYESKAGTSYAADISSFYKSKEFEFSDKSGYFALGINISNIGTKISYTDQDNEFIPINMRFGGAFTLNIDQFNSITILSDLNKLLVPTTPEYRGDTIVRGMNPDVSVALGMIQSFYDAPGIANEQSLKRNVMAEEWQEVTKSFGMEYWYNKQFAIRAGYFLENERKGNRKFYTVGLGLRLNVLGLDFSYLVPRFYNNNPLANTVRVTLTLNIDGAKNK